MNNCSLMPFTEQGLRMRFGLVGCGWIVERYHIPAMRQSDKVDIVATADVAPERARLAVRIAGASAGAVSLLKTRKAAAHAV